MGADRRVRRADPALVRALRLRRSRRGDHLLRSAPAHVAVRGVFHPRSTRASRRAVPLHVAAQSHDVRRATSRSVPTATAISSAACCSNTSTSRSSIASSACSTSSSSVGSRSRSASASAAPEHRLDSAEFVSRCDRRSCNVSRPVLRSLLPSRDGSSAAGPEVREGQSRSGKCGAVPKVPRALPLSAGASRRTPNRDAALPFAMTSVALIGGGRMGSALLGGLLDGGWDADELAVAEVDADRRRELEQQFPKVRVVPSPAWAVADADVVDRRGEAGRRCREPARGRVVVAQRRRSCCRSRPASRSRRSRRSCPAVRWCARCRTPRRSWAWARRRSRPVATPTTDHLALARGCSARWGSS